MITTQKITLDFNLRGSTPRIQAVQGDLYTRMVEIALFSSKVPWPIPEQTAVLIRYRKPDRTVGAYDTLPNGSPAHQLQGNIVTISIAPDALILPGEVSLVVSLISGGKVLSAFEIILEVQHNHGTGKLSEGAGSCISGMLPGPESAQEGQILAVEAVTPIGTVQKLRAIDLPYYNSVQSISRDEELSVETETVYRVTMSDGAEHTFAVQNGRDGADGRTGADGKDGYTPVKGLDYFDGEPGKDGEPGISAYAYAQDGGYTGTEQEFAKKLAAQMPDTLPNPYPLTINGKIYDGSEEVNVVVTGGAASDAVSLGQTPVTLSENTNVRLVGDGEHSYTIIGKTEADLSTAEIAKNSVALTEKEDYIELTVSGSPANWYNAYAALTFSGLTVGESYAFCIESFGIDTANLSFNGYFLIKNASGSELGRIEDKPAGLASVTFTANTETVVVQWYPANNYYWSQGYRTALIGDLYINKASDGTDRTGVINESGTFTDSYSLGQLSKGVTITSAPSCEVYSVSGGGGSGSPGEVSSPLAGKTVVCFGDSLFGMYTGGTSAPAYAAQKTGATVYNVGFSGCRMSKHPYASHNPFCMYALADAIASGDWSAQDTNAANGSANFQDQLAILKGIDFNTVDYIVIHYGTNDFAAGEGVAIDNASNPKATNTLCGALRYSVENLLGAFPKLKIFVSLPAFRYWTADDGTVTDSDEKTNVKGNTLPEFVAALAETAKEYKLPVIDCYYGLGINKSNANTFLADGTHHNVEGRKRFGEYIGAKLISEGDTFHGADSETGGGSASIDVTAEVGQTIVVEEVDENGKPTKWKAAEYPLAVNEMIPKTTYTPLYDSTFGLYLFTLETGPVLVEGQKYTVVFDGVEYRCTAKRATLGNLNGIYIGNGVLTGDVTGEPFALVNIDGFTSLSIANFDGNEHTFSLSDVKLHEDYILQSAYPYYIEVSGSGIAETPYICNETVANIEKIYRSGREIKVKAKGDADSGIYVYLVLAFAVPTEFGTMLSFLLRIYSNAHTCFTLTPQEDGTYLVTDDLPI